MLTIIGIILVIILIYAIVSLLNALIVWGLVGLCSLAFGCATLSFGQAFVIGIAISFVVTTLQGIFNK